MENQGASQQAWKFGFPNFKHTSSWSVASTLLVVAVVIPILIILLGSILLPAESWSHVLENLVLRYSLNTLIVVVLTSLFSLLFALPSAWFVSTYQFPLRNLFSWALILPLAIPTYVAAYAYSDLLEALLPFQVMFKKNYGTEASITADWLSRRFTLSLILASVLYPYIYLSARASFSLQGRSSIEAAQTLGHNIRDVFWKVALPMCRPAIIAGLALIIMEVFNDYGAVLFFGVPTLTVGVFQTWHGLGDTGSALRLACIVLIIILFILSLERATRGRASFEEISNRFSPRPQHKLPNKKAIIAFLFCLIPLAVGFLIPAGKLLYWASTTYQKVLTKEFLALSFDAIILSVAGSFVIVLLALLLFYTTRIHRTRFIKTLIRVSTIGYAVPGVVVAVGVLFLTGWLDSWSGKLIFGGSIFALLFAYTVRFLAVARAPIVSGMNRLHSNLDEASRTLGHSPSSTLYHIILPLLKGPLLAAAMLIFVDLLKELPITLLLRPFNFETLATKAFSLASEGRIPECAIPSLLIILVGSIGLYSLNHFLEKKSFLRKS